MIRLYLEMRSPLAQGAQLDLLRMRCARLPPGAAEEVWERLLLVDATVASWVCALQDRR